MRIFENAKGYATQANAIKAVEKKDPDYLKGNQWTMVATPEGRFIVTLIGSAQLDAFHFFGCVAIIAT